MQIKCGLVADVSAKGDKQMSWKIGDIAICITPGSRMEGCEIIIRRGLETRAHGGNDGFPPKISPTYGVDPGFPTPNGAEWWAAEPQHLIPLPPANEVTTWDASIFKPRELVTEK